MSQASEWARRTREEQPRLVLLATDIYREPSLTAEVTTDGACAVFVCSIDGISREIVIPKMYAATLGTFLVRTFSEEHGP